MNGTHVRPGDDAVVERLHGRLVAAAEAEGLLDVAYTTVDSPIGPLLLAATEAGLVRVAFEREGHDAVLEQLAARVSPRVLRAPARLDTVTRQLDEYFTGRRTVFDVALDLGRVTAFHRLVLGELAAIGYGSTRSYAEVARAVGRPGAVRAVGTACATNPVPIVVPCHRVLRSDGTVGGYLGGGAAKETLLWLESAA